MSSPLKKCKPTKRKPRWTEKQCLIQKQMKVARLLWGPLSKIAVRSLQEIISRDELSLTSGDLLYLQSRWYVTHAGLLRLAQRRRCLGIEVLPGPEFCNPAASHWVFKATVYKSRTSKGFTGFGDADPSNTTEVVRGAEMRVAETRAVNRALRKAYGIGICSVEELGASSPSGKGRDPKRLPAQQANGNGWNGGPKVRDRLCQLIRQHHLDAGLVKSYAIEFCGVKTLREATREQLENFLQHLADWAEKDRNALLCQLNSYISPEEGVA